MSEWMPAHYTAFANSTYLASGNLDQVALKAKEVIDAHPHAALLIFHD